jgi:NTP pyrophosphatase (non-canonical NTP hydrolase)
MLLNEYQTNAIKTAIYPKELAILYPTLGLAGEFGEVVTKLVARQQGELVKEMGDMLWYLANLANDLDATLTDALDQHTLSATSTFEQVQLWAIDHRGSFLVTSPENFIATTVGAICEGVKKLHRDDQGFLTPLRRDILLMNLAWVLIGVAALANTIDAKLDLVARGNLAKLASRASRGTLTGDGDNR